MGRLAIQEFMLPMEYHLSKKVPLQFDDAIDNITEQLRREGFGIITTIDLKKTFRDKLNTTFRNYTILGACNPRFAYESLLMEDKIGVFLPCNVVVQEHEDGQVEISIVDPVKLIAGTHDLSLKTFASEIKLSMENALRNV